MIAYKILMILQTLAIIYLLIKVKKLEGILLDSIDLIQNVLDKVKGIWISIDSIKDDIIKIAEAFKNRNKTTNK